MNETTLQCAITVKADEAMLERIQDILTCTDNPTVAENVALAIKQALIKAGFSDDFEVELCGGHLSTHYGQGEGLNAQEWLERNRFAEGPDLQTEDFIISD